MEIPAGLTQSAFSELIGCRVQRLEEGVAEVALTLEPQLRNRAGKLHGGAIFSLVDITMGLACSSAHGFDRQSAMHLIQATLKRRAAMVLAVMAFWLIVAAKGWVASIRWVKP